MCRRVTVEVGGGVWCVCLCACVLVVCVCVCRMHTSFI